MMPLLRPLPRRDLSQEEFYALGPPRLPRLPRLPCRLPHLLSRSGWLCRRGAGTAEEAQSSASTSTDCVLRAPPAIRSAPLTGETSK